MKPFLPAVLGIVMLLPFTLHSGTAGDTPPSAKTWNFDSEKPKAPPEGFTFGRTGSGREGRWIVRDDDDAPSSSNLLAQLDGDATEDRFPIAFTGPEMKDLRLSVKCKPVAGKVAQECGLVFRLKDADNYYLTRANALEDNVRLYHVVKGSHRQLAGWNGKVASGVWHELTVEAQGNHFQVFFNGEKVIDAHDKTLAGAGKIGLWTKADSIIYFDDLSVQPLAAGGQHQ